MRRDAAPGCAAVGRSGLARHTRDTGEWPETDGAHCGPPQRAGAGRSARRRSGSIPRRELGVFDPAPCGPGPLGAVRRNAVEVRRVAAAPARHPHGNVDLQLARWLSGEKAGLGNPRSRVRVRETVLFATFPAVRTGKPIYPSPPFALGVRALRPCGLRPIGERLVPEGTFARAQNQPPMWEWSHSEWPPGRTAAPRTTPLPLRGPGRTAAPRTRPCGTAAARTRNRRRAPGRTRRCRRANLRERQRESHGETSPGYLPPVAQWLRPDPARLRSIARCAPLRTPPVRTLPGPRSHLAGPASGGWRVGAANKLGLCGFP